MSNRGRQRRKPATIDHDARKRCLNTVMDALVGQPLTAGMAGCADALRYYAIAGASDLEHARGVLRAFLEDSIRMLDADFPRIKEAYARAKLIDGPPAGSA